MDLDWGSLVEQVRAHVYLKSSIGTGKDVLGAGLRDIEERVLLEGKSRRSLRSWLKFYSSLIPLEAVDDVEFPDKDPSYEYRDAEYCLTSGKLRVHVQFVDWLFGNLELLALVCTKSSSIRFLDIVLDTMLSICDRHRLGNIQVLVKKIMSFEVRSNVLEYINSEYTSLYMIKYVISYYFEDANLLRAISVWIDPILFSNNVSLRESTNDLVAFVKELCSILESFFTSCPELIEFVSFCLELVSENFAFDDMSTLDILWVLLFKHQFLILFKDSTVSNIYMSRLLSLNSSSNIQIVRKLMEGLEHDIVPVELLFGVLEKVQALASEVCPEYEPINEYSFLVLLNGSEIAHLESTFSTFTDSWSMEVCSDPRMFKKYKQMNVLAQEDHTFMCFPLTSFRREYLEPNPTLHTHGEDLLENCILSTLYHCFESNIHLPRPLPTNIMDVMETLLITANSYTQSIHSRHDLYPLIRNCIGKLNQSSTFTLQHCLRVLLDEMQTRIHFYKHRNKSISSNLVDAIRFGKETHKKIIKTKEFLNERLFQIKVYDGLVDTLQVTDKGGDTCSILELYQRVTLLINDDARDSLMLVTKEVRDIKHRVLEELSRSTDKCLWSKQGQFAHAFELLHERMVYICHSTFDKLIKDDIHQEGMVLDLDDPENGYICDDVFISRLEDLHWVEYKHFDIPVDTNFSDYYYLECFKRELDSLDSFQGHTLHDKMRLLRRAFGWITDLSKIICKDQYVEMDILFPILVYSLIQVSPRTLCSNIKFLCCFRSFNLYHSPYEGLDIQGLPLQGAFNQERFCLLQFISAVKFLMNLSWVQLSGVTHEEWIQHMNNVEF